MSTGIIVTLGVVGGIPLISASFVLLRVMLYHIQVMIEEGSEYHRFIKMRYKEFEPLYYMAPESYELYHFQGNGPCIRYIDDDLQAYHIFFPTCHEWLKAKKLFHYKHNEKLRRIRLKQKREFLKSAQKDIDKFTEKLKGENKNG